MFFLVSLNCHFWRFIILLPSAIFVDVSPPATHFPAAAAFQEKKNLCLLSISFAIFLNYVCESFVRVLFSKFWLPLLLPLLFKKLLSWLLLPLPLLLLLLSLSSLLLRAKQGNGKKIFGIKFVGWEKQKWKKHISFE